MEWPAEVLSIYNAYPRRLKKQDACKAILKAVERLGKDRQLSYSGSISYLQDRVDLYAAAVATWPSGDLCFVPHPTTWFNGSRYDDDEAEWRRTAGGQPRREFDERGAGGPPVR